MTIVPLGSQVSFDATASSPETDGENISSASLVYICNTDTTNVHNVTLKKSNGATIGSFSIGPGDSIFIKKKNAELLLASNTALKATPSGYASQ